MCHISVGFGGKLRHIGIFFSDVIHMDFEHQTLHSPYVPILLENPFNIYIKRYFTVALNWHICRPSEVSKIKHKK